MNRFSRTCDAFMEVSWLLALITVPMFFIYDSFRIFEVNKIALFLAIMLVGLAAWGCKWISLGRGFHSSFNHKKFLEQVKTIPLLAPILALAGLVLISTLFSISPLTSLLGSSNRFDGAIVTLFYGLFFILIAANLRRREQMERLMAVLAAVCLAVDLYSILQHVGLDPLYWNADIKVRAISTIGYFIFTAAFLSMALFPLLGWTILAFQSFLRGGPARLTDLFRALLYGMVSLANLLGIWFADSRGPLIGLFFGAGLFIVLFLLYNRLRRVLSGVLVLAAVLLTLLVLLNIPNSPLAPLRESTLLGPLGRLFNAEAGTGRMRVLIWQGMSRLTAPHNPIVFPDKTTDRWNVIRPLLGYGPDTLDLGYAGYYNPEMYALESRTFLLDRAHNEFWDTLYFGGVLGLAAEYALFLSLFFYGLRWLGFIAGDWERNLFWGLSAAGCLLGVLLPILAGSPEYIGLGCPLGLLSGLAGVIILRIFRPASVKASPGTWQVISMISIMAAVLSHYIEILFGISMVASSLLLWMFAGLFVCIGWIIPALQTSHQPVRLAVAPVQVPSPVPGVSQAAASRKPALQIKYQAAAIHAGLLSLIMVTLGAAFLSTAQMSGSILQTISALFIYKPDLAQPPSYGMAGMFLAVLLLGGALLQLGDDSLNGRKPGWVNLALALVCALLLSLLTWVARASQLVGIQQAMLRQGNLESVFAGLPAMLMLSLAALLVISLGLAWIMGSSDTFTPFSFTWPAASGVALVILVAGLLINFFSLRPMQANVLYVQVLRQVEAHDYGTALKLYDQVVQLSPSDSDHLRYAANLYGETINTLPDPAQKERFFQAGLKYVQKAAALEPLSIDNTMALARFYRLGGDFSPDPAQKNARFFMANTYFAQALKGFPARIDFWLEWAEFQALAGDIQGAFDKAGAALAVDETYAPTYQLIGDLHAVYADSLSDPAVRSASFNKAQQAYQKQADLLVNQKANAAQAFFNIAKIDESLGQYPQAYQAYTLAAQQNMGDLQWQIYKRLADVSAKLKDAAGQRQYLQKALEIAPKPEQPALQAELNALTP